MRLVAWNRMALYSLRYVACDRKPRDFLSYMRRLSCCMQQSCTMYEGLNIAFNSDNPSLCQYGVPITLLPLILSPWGGHQYVHSDVHSGKVECCGKLVSSKRQKTCAVYVYIRISFTMYSAEQPVGAFTVMSISL